MALALIISGRLKKDFQTQKVVMITAHDNLSDREKAKFEGVDFFIGKPFQKNLFLERVDSLDGQNSHKCGLISRFLSFLLIENVKYNRKGRTLPDLL
jgi:DNA-binding response OmpR family regulator